MRWHMTRNTHARSVAWRFDSASRSPRATWTPVWYVGTAGDAHHSKSKSCEATPNFDLPVYLLCVGLVRPAMSSPTSLASTRSSRRIAIDIMTRSWLSDPRPSMTPNMIAMMGPATPPTAHAPGSLPVIWRSSAASFGARSTELGRSMLDRELDFRTAPSSWRRVGKRENGAMQQHWSKLADIITIPADWFRCTPGRSTV
mmetsp:Transcript_101541/g.287719  ORF Transcript_101541/g.287719 Transcript_101541/m.287719 type:complete len:200 (-) Transcript_101541:23-622(-)